MAAPSSTMAFLDALRAAFPTPQASSDEKPKQNGSVDVSSASAKTKKRPAPLQSASLPPPPRPQWMEEIDGLDAFNDPLDTRAYSQKDTQLLRVLCVDHVDLREATEREKTRSAVGAVVTTKRLDAKSKATNAAGSAKPTVTPAQQLLQHCASYIAATQFAIFSTEELAETIVQTVQDANGQDDLIQSHLFGLVGVEGMDLIAFVMQNSKSMARGGHVTRQSLQDAAKQQLHQAATRTQNPTQTRPAASFSVHSASELQQQKQQRKAQRKATNAASRGDEDDDGLQWLEAAGYDLEVLRLQRQFEQDDQRHESTSMLLKEFGELRGGYNTTGAAGQLTSGGMLSLPSSTKRTYFKGYEHVSIPAHAKKKLAKGETLVPIRELEPFAQTAFQGTQTLNRLQSKLFEAAYSTNQNLLVCAPTGAGKTNVAMLTILHEIKSQMQRQGQDRNAMRQMKIIYVAPMKALAQEVVTKFGERLRDLKLRVAELTGDMQLTKKEIEDTHVIVTTPEKWDVITRKSTAQQALLSQVKLLIIDEVHLLADQRGPVIETIVARTLRRVESTQSMIRIVGLSATLPNYADVATFLRVYVPPGDANAQNAATNGGKGGLFFFDATYRPVPLDQTFIGVSTSGNSLKAALDLSASQLVATLETEEDRAKAKAATAGGAASATMSKQRQVQLLMNKLALTHCLAQVRNQEQVMVFVHSRKETAATMRAIIELALNDEDEPGLIESFLPPQELPKLPMSLIERLQKSRNKELKELFAYGLGIHHAGMLRSDRNLTEELFEKGYIRVLCCTATLAWGVNLPAHSVLIKGTQVYNADKGGITQLSMLDVMQIFGRAGRPQYDSSGDAVLMTTQEQLPHYLRLLTQGIPMESALIKALPDHLNAEIVSGTVSNLDEACEWLSYTYLFVRMKKNPLAYGLKYDDVQGDPLLVGRRKQLLMDAAEKLQACRMIKILREKTRLDQPADETTKICFAVTSMGRVASHFYIQHTSIQTFNDLLDTKSSTNSGDHDDDSLAWDKALLVLCSSHEFEQLKAREDEMNELEKLQRNFGRFDVRGGGIESYTGKTNVLLQALIGRARVSSFTLISDTNYVAQNASRVCRALFEICLKKHSARQAEKFLQLANAIDQKMWWDQNVLLQLPNVPMDVVGLVDQQHVDLYDALSSEPAHRLDKLSAKARKWVTLLPFVDVENVLVQPFGGNMLRLSYALRPLFHEWREHAVGGRSLSYWLWVEDAVTGFIYHSEYVVLHQSRYLGWKEGTQRLDMECFVPVFTTSDNREANYVVRLLSDRFVGVESYYDVQYVAPDDEMSAHGTKKTDKDKENDMYTKLLTLHPQPLRSLQNQVYQSLYASKFQWFNPIQTQAFHQLYHTDGNVLLCAPTGSGKTMCAELAMLRVWNKLDAAAKNQVNETHEPRAESKAETKPPPPPSLIVYIAPLKALAREKVAEWKARFETHARLRKQVVEVTGDTLVDVAFVLRAASIVVTTPEKWDLLTRSGSVGRQLMARTALVVMDEVHLVGESSRGAVLEVLVSRLRRFRDGGHAIRLLGLSTALANAHDVGHWLGITKHNGGQVYNFRASVRPVPMEVHIQGFPERHYVSRMAAMNKPTFLAIRTHSPDKPALIFVSSKAQTKLTALDLMSFCVSSADSASSSAKPFLQVDDSIMDAIVHGRGSRVHDETLRHTLSFGIGLHHAGLSRNDRDLVEKLFRDKMIQVVISTATLAWGVNLPAHLVVVKGTEFFQNGRYRSYPLSDLLQMIGRAGRPLLDTKGVACVLVEDAKKNMIQRLLYEPLAIESTLGDHLENHLNAEIASGLIQHTSDVVQYLSWSLLFQRVVKNPSFYGYGQQSRGGGAGGVETFFKQLVDGTLTTLVDNECVAMENKTGGGGLKPTRLGKIAAALYVDVRSVSRMHRALTLSISQFKNKTEEQAEEATSDYWLLSVLRALCASCVELLETTPLRHHEVQSGLAHELCAQVRFSPLTKLFTTSKKLLLETHGSEIKAFLLLQMHLQGLRMPSSDFGNDLRALLDQVPRLLSAAIDICALLKHEKLLVAGIRLSQGIVQGVWPSSRATNPLVVLTQLPHVDERVARQLTNKNLQITSLDDLRGVLGDTKRLAQLKTSGVSWSDAQLKDIGRVLDGIPRVDVAVQSRDSSENNKTTTVVTVELRAIRERGAAHAAPVLANAHTARGRFQKPKPYGFYVVLSRDETLLQVKHVAWKSGASRTLFAPVVAAEKATRLTVAVLSDAIAGIDQIVPVER